MEHFWEYAAATFVVVQVLKFVWGWLAERYTIPEMDAQGELFLSVTTAFIVTIVSGGTVGDFALAASIAFFAVTIWAAIQLKRMHTLVQMTRGVR